MTGNLDGDLDSGGTPATPNADSSQRQGDSGGSVANALQQSLDMLSKQIVEIDKRTKSLQSDKDRGTDKNRKEIQRVVAEVEKLKARGYSEDDAFDRVELDGKIRRIVQQLDDTPAQTQPTGNGNGSAVDKASVLSQYGLNENDPDVAASLSGKFNSPLELENAALKVAYQRANKPSPDASASPAVQGTPPGKPDLKPAYIKEIEANRGNRASIKAIQEKYRKQGFDPGSVGFSV